MEFPEGDSCNYPHFAITITDTIVVRNIAVVSVNLIVTITVTVVTTIDYYLNQPIVQSLILLESLC